MDLRKLTDSEWLVLCVLWNGYRALGDITAALRAQTGWSRNTVHTYLTRMAEKGLVLIDRESSPHRYSAAVTRAACEAAERRSLLDRVYQGAAGRLVAAFVRDGSLTAAERDELRRLLDEMEV